MTTRRLIILVPVAAAALSLAAVTVGACAHDHRHPFPRDPPVEDGATAHQHNRLLVHPPPRRRLGQESDVSSDLLPPLPGVGCDERDQHEHGYVVGGKHFPPRHPGDTEHAIIQFEPGSEVYYPIDDETDDDDDGGYDEDYASNITTADGRGLRKRRRRRGVGHRRALRRCGVPDPTPHQLETSLKVLDDWEARHPGRKLAIHRMMAGNTTAAADAGPNRTIRLWWHVLKAGNTPLLGAWSRAQVVTSVNLANRYFANSPFKFVLAGITQTTNRQWFNCPYEDSYATELAFKTALRREGADTLNVYMCDLRQGQGLWGATYTPSILIGYPEYDGILLSNPFTKRDGHTALDAQMTFIHEAGHWLGLYHTWTGTCDPSKGGDSIFDTPAHVSDTWGYKGWQKCFAGKTYNTCPDNVAGVDPGLDPVLNHMNYVYTQCEYQYGQFTTGQMTKMVSMFDTYRFNKTTCRKTNVPCLRNDHCCSNICINGSTSTSTMYCA